MPSNGFSREPLIRFGDSPTSPLGKWRSDRHATTQNGFLAVSFAKGREGIGRGFGARIRVEPMGNPSVQQLVKSLEALVAISEIQSESLARSRERAKRIEKHFESRMSGATSSDLASDGSSVESGITQLSDIQEAAARTQLWELEFMSAFEALMRLWSNEDLRSKCEAIFGNLRQIRVIAASDSSTGFPLEGLQKLEGNKDLPLERRKESILEAMKSHHEGMKEWMKGREAEWDEKIERSDRLLVQSLEMARSMID